MTIEEKERAVIAAAMDWRDATLSNPHTRVTGLPTPVVDALAALGAATYQLAVTCPECNAGGHICPGCGGHIPHTEGACAGCAPAVAGVSATRVDGTELSEKPAPEHAGVNGQCPDYGSKLDPCPPDCAKGTCVAGACRVQSSVGAKCEKPFGHDGMHRADGATWAVTDGIVQAVADALPEIGEQVTAFLEAVEPELIWVPRTWVDVRPGDTVRMPGSEATAYVQTAVHLRWHVDPRSSEYQPTALEWAAVRVQLAESYGGAERGRYDMDPGKPIEIQRTHYDMAAATALFDGDMELAWSGRVGMIVE